MRELLILMHRFRLASMEYDLGDGLENYRKAGVLLRRVRAHKVRGANAEIDAAVDEMTKCVETTRVVLAEEARVEHTGLDETGSDDTEWDGTEWDDCSCVPTTQLSEHPTPNTSPGNNPPRPPNTPDHKLGPDSLRDPSLGQFHQNSSKTLLSGPPDTQSVGGAHGGESS
jgi:hypothetical protein